MYDLNIFLNFNPLLQHTMCNGFPKFCIVREIIPEIHLEWQITWYHRGPYQLCELCVSSSISMVGDIYFLLSISLKLICNCYHHFNTQCGWIVLQSCQIVVDLYCRTWFPFSSLSNLAFFKSMFLRGFLSFRKKHSYEWLNVCIIYILLNWTVFYSLTLSMIK